MDASALVLRARARLERGNEHRSAKSIDHLLAAAKKRGSVRTTDPASFEAALGAARVQARAARTRE